MKKTVFDGRNLYWVENNRICVCQYEKITAGFRDGCSKVPSSEKIVRTFNTNKEAEEELEQMEKEIRTK